MPIASRTGLQVKMALGGPNEQRKFLLVKQEKYVTCWGGKDELNESTNIVFFFFMLVPVWAVDKQQIEQILDQTKQFKQILKDRLDENNNLTLGKGSLWVGYNIFVYGGEGLGSLYATFSQTPLASGDVRNTTWVGSASAIVGFLVSEVFRTDSASLKRDLDQLGFDKTQFQSAQADLVSLNLRFTDPYLTDEKYQDTLNRFDRFVEQYKDILKVGKK